MLVGCGLLLGEAHGVEILQQKIVTLEVFMFSFQKK